MKVGQVLGHYHVVRSLGQGGMGSVYEANDTRLNRQVAIKVLPSAKANNPEWLKRFEREAQAVAALSHPNIVTIHSVEETDNEHFLILELVDGLSLDKAIPDGGLPLDRFFDIAIPLADAVAAAHRRGIAHRDLKPSNVMVDKEGRVKVLDFGIAKLMNESLPDEEAATQIGSEALTEEGKIVGTVAYMSPEQAEGKPADQRTDIFSLGILMYEMATGDRPFEGDTKLSILAAIVKDEPKPIYERNHTMPRHLARIVKKALEKDVERRYQSVVELRNDLIELKEEIDAGEPMLTGTALTDPGSQAAYRDPTPERRRSFGMWTGVAGVLVAIAALAYAFVYRTGEPPPAPGPPRVDQTIQLTTAPESDFGGTISDDGEWFAFTRQGEDGYVILLQAVGSRNAIPIATDGVSPAFSFDGDHIAFSDPPVLTSNSAIGGGILVVGRTGDDRRRLTDSGYNPAWSPDGSRIVYADEFVSWRPYSRFETSSKLHVVDVDSGEVETFDDIPDAVQPAWSPNGHRIAYWAMANGRRDIWTVAADGSDARRVTDDEFVDYSPVWTPNGDWLYFASTRSGSMNIWRAAIDEQTGEPRGEPQQVTTGGLGDAGMLSFSADGGRLLYTNVLIRGDIVAADLDPIDLSIGETASPIVAGTRRLAQPDVSSDGNRLVYRTEGAQQDIYVADVTSGEEQQLTNDLAKDWAPRWSPDGARIAYYSNRSGDYELWLINPDGTNPTQLTTTPDNAPQAAIWSPDGARLATFLANAGDNAYILAVEPGQPQQGAAEPPKALAELEPLPRPDYGDERFQPFDWHPDGNLIVGAVDPGGGAGDHTMLFMYDIAAESYRQLVPGTQPRFMADGRRVLFRSPEQDAFSVLDLATGDVRAISIPEGLGAIESMLLSPDDAIAYLIRVEQEADIWMLELR